MGMRCRTRVMRESSLDAGNECVIGVYQGSSSTPDVQSSALYERGGGSRTPRDFSPFLSCLFLPSYFLFLFLFFVCAFTGEPRKSKWPSRWILMLVLYLIKTSSQNHSSSRIAVGP